ncbi:MAG: hypothetical protein QOD89_1745 [Bradyrhizobium sp.]|jgi:peptide deformylase|nr:hypothetical protein [Bradyrhizobium sp.]
MMTVIDKIEKALRNSVDAPGDEIQSTLDRFISLGILRWDDPRLYQRSSPVDFEHDDVSGIYSRLRDVMLQVWAICDFTRSFGLAAPQLGVLRRAFVFGFTTGELHFAVNPRIIERSPEIEIDFEGCLSLWEWRGEVARPKRIVIEYQDVRGALLRRSEAGERARLLLHECDHLDGIIYPHLMHEPSKLVGPRDYARICSGRVSSQVE